MMQSNEVKQFYNTFLESRMLDYRLTNGNKRINLATEFVLKNIKPDDHILDIGCGIGIVTERIAKKVKNGFIWACDISDQNIWYAKQTIPNKNIDFVTADIFEQFELLKERINEPIDVFILIDVMEHLPKERHPELIQKLNSIASKYYNILLTFPSEYYQQYLEQNNPNELQIIDEHITFNHLLNLTKHNDLIIKYFEFKDVWMTKQYVHCKLEKRSDIMTVAAYKSPNILNRVINRIIGSYRKRKYITKVFEN